MPHSFQLLRSQLYLNVLLFSRIQVLISTANVDGNASSEALQAQVRILLEREQSQAAEIEYLRRQLAQFNAEASLSGYEHGRSLADADYQNCVQEKRQECFMEKIAKLEGKTDEDLGIVKKKETRKEDKEETHEERHPSPWSKKWRKEPPKKNTEETNEETRKEEPHEGREGAEGEESARTGQEGAEGEEAALGEEEEEGGAGEGTIGEEEGETKEEEEEEGEEEEEEEEIGPVDKTLAICLLSFITLTMMNVRMTHFDDLDVKVAVWNMISQTMSIFVAVLMFVTIDTILHRFVPAGTFPYCTIILDVVCAAICFCSMQVSVAIISGSFDSDPFPGLEQCKSEKETHKMIKEQKEQKQRRFIAVATLMAHMTGFAAINVGGGVQHLDFFLKNPPLMFLVPLGILIVQIFACRMVRRIRLYVIRYLMTKSGIEGNYDKLVSVQRDEEVLHKETGIRWCLDKWDEECYDAENEISGLAVSFLLLQAIRYNLTGVMPDNMGIEETGYLHPQSHINHLMLVGAGFVLFFLIVKKLGKSIEGEEAEPGTFFSFMKRMYLIGVSTSAMGFAWALMYVARWQLTFFFPLIDPNVLVFRVILAVLITFISVALIIVLDIIADSDCTGAEADEAIRGVLKALCVLVGFCWEQGFDGAVEVLAESYFKDHIVVAEICLTGGVFIIVYPVWRRHILRTLIKLEAELETGDPEEAVNRKFSSYVAPDSPHHVEEQMEQRDSFKLLSKGSS